MFNVVECYKSIQGEGLHTGYISVFVRFQECNMNCTFCDTNRMTYSVRTEQELFDEICAVAGDCRMVIFTGGEPLMQKNLLSLVLKLHTFRYRMYVETNGTLPLGHLEKYIIGVSLSPKVPRNKVPLRACQSLKILYPYLDGVVADDWQDFNAIEKSLQVISPEQSSKELILQAIAECERLSKGHEPWKLGIQLHKLIGVR